MVRRHIIHVRQRDITRCFIDKCQFMGEKGLCRSAALTDSDCTLCVCRMLVRTSPEYRTRMAMDSGLPAMSWPNANTP